jgi:hypothetical protein
VPLAGAPWPAEADEDCVRRLQRDRDRPDRRAELARRLQPRPDLDPARLERIRRQAGQGGLDPGSPSLADWAAAAQKANKDLFVRGYVTHPSAAESFYYDLHGATGGRGGRTRA